MKQIPNLPTIPDKKYFTIGEASKLCGVKPHVLRYWEQEFPQINPAKRRGGRRYYTHDDIETIRTIRDLLYFKGFTIAGAMLQLKALKKNCSNLAPNTEHLDITEIELERKSPANNLNHHVTESASIDYATDHATSDAVTTDDNTSEQKFTEINIIEDKNLCATKQDLANTTKDLADKDKDDSTVKSVVSELENLLREIKDGA